MQEFTDKYGDTLSVYGTRHDDGTISVYLDADEDDGELHTELVLDADTARKVALAIHSAAGDVNGLGPVLASTISFNEGVLRLATLHQKTVEFRYTKKGSSVIETRRFQPSTCSGEGEHFRFTGYDPDRGATRAYRLDRIKGTVAVIA